MRGKVLLVLIGLAAAGCGAGSGFGRPASASNPLPSASGAPPPAHVPATPTPTSAASPERTLVSPGTITFADSGSTVRLSRGERLNVFLSNFYGAWDPPEASGDAVQRTASSGGYPSRASARATFVAVAEGTATITARTDYACLHAQPPCAIAQRFWMVHVIVSG